MRRFFAYGLTIALLAACSTQEKDFQTPVQEDVIYYASFEQPAEERTRVYANEDLLLRWTADDRVSIFGKNTYNQQYKFLGETGDNSGGFSKVDGAEYMTGNPISHTVSVYPYQASTKITEDEILSLNLPSEQHYAENTFGLYSNTMVSVSADNFLQYKNVGGYLMLKLYGEGVSVSSITLKGNNGEKLAGKATVTMPLDGMPSAVMAEDATTTIALTCETPVQLGATAEESTQFWFVVPPVSFSKGFTIIVNTSSGGSFETMTDKTIAFERNKLSKMSPIEVEVINNIVFADENVKAKLVAAFDTNSDGELSYSEAADVVSGESIKEVFGSDRNYRSFDEFQFFTGITTIPDELFKDWTLMTSIILPDSITRIGSNAFRNCAQMSSIDIPDGVLSIGSYAFGDCYKLESINIPDGIETLATGLFVNCNLLSSVILPQGLKVIGSTSFANCISLKQITIPDGVTSISYNAFESSGLTSVRIPGSVNTIGQYAFAYCKGLAEVLMCEGVSIIEEGVFNNCSNLRIIVIPQSLIKCTGNVFTNCSSVSSVYISSIEDWLGFLERSSLYAYTCPLEATTQAVHIYAAGSEITTLDLSSSLVRIPNYAFKNCAYLSKVIIPETVSSIGAYAFYACSGLTFVKSLAEAAPRGGYGMFASTGNCPIYVPAQSVNEYKTAEVWSSYADRIQAIPSPSVPVPEAVDLGLPSGLKWASFNLGASKPEEYGDYFAWGEVLGSGDGKNNFDFYSYKWYEGQKTGTPGLEPEVILKYNYDSEYGPVDNLDVLEPEDDAANTRLGGSWRMPTKTEFEELRSNCDWVWTTENGVAGMRITSKVSGYTDKSIFLPGAGNIVNTTYQSVGEHGSYWSSNIDHYTSYQRPYGAMCIHFGESYYFLQSSNRSCGFTIRAVTN